MSVIDKKLRWRYHAEEFDMDEKKILIALSHKEWIWRTLGNLQAVTQLESRILEEKLSGLIKKRLIKGSVFTPNSSVARPIFGLIERDIWE